MKIQSEKFWTIGRLIATAVVVMLICSIGYVIFWGGSRSTTEARIVLPGKDLPEADRKKAPPDFEIPTLDGRKIRLSEYRGKVLIVDFWATWCPPCRRMIPQLVRIANQHRDRGLEVIGLHIDDRGRSSTEDINKFIGQFGINYTVGIASDEVFIAYLGAEQTAIPQTLVFDRDGRLMLHLIGYTEADAAKLDQAVGRAILKK
jgi:thiol-disulfide isomerase/thioredoxin